MAVAAGIPVVLTRYAAAQERPFPADDEQKRSNSLDSHDEDHHSEKESMNGYGSYRSRARSRIRFQPLGKDLNGCDRANVPKDCDENVGKERVEEDDRHA